VISEKSWGQSAVTAVTAVCPEARLSARDQARPKTQTSEMHGINLCQSVTIGLGVLVERTMT